MKPSRLAPRSLYARLALVLLLLLGTVGAAWIATSVHTTALYQEELEQRLNRDLARQLLKDTEILDQGVSEADLEHIFHVLMVVNPRIEVYLLDAEGRILSYSAPEGRVVRERVSLEPIRRFLRADSAGSDPVAADGPRLPLRGDDPRQAEGRKIFSVAPIPASAFPDGTGVADGTGAAGETSPAGGDATTAGERGGYLYVVLGGERYESVVAGLRSNKVLRMAAGVTVGALAVAFLVGLILFRRLTRRLARLDRRIRGFHRDDGPAGRRAASADAGVSVSGGRATEDHEAAPPGDEIDRLEAGFARMAERIEHQIDELAALDELRRELVANVSHDLRTPIAALRGYLETLLIKEESLSPEERSRYLTIALRHAEHLGKLVAQLFELARLDIEEGELELEPVSLPELAQDVVQKFHLAAERQGIDLAADLPESVPFVQADIRLLERALDNLLENALAHTPEGGRVTLAVAAANGGARVRLEDTGSGIPADELPRIFDRFQRGSAPVEGRGRRQQPGAGLGLAITKRILDLHGADLAVESEVGHGTTFSFELPLHR